MLQKIAIHKVELNPFDTIRKDMMLITAGDMERHNTMTANWGGMGVLWGRDVMYVFIRKSRYTHDFMESSNGFTCTFFPPAFNDKLMYLGSHSGRDENKEEKMGMVAEALEKGRVTFQGANLVFSCSKLYCTDILPPFITDVGKWYGDKDYHTLYVGGIDAVYAAF